MIGALRKLRGRTAAELVDRGRQAGWRWLERRGIGDIGEPDRHRVSSLLGEAWGDDSRVLRGSFFAAFEDRDATLAALREVDPAFEVALRVRADRLLAGQYDLLGHRGLSFGDPVDWWREPVSGIRAPSSHWSRIDFLDPAVVGDHKLVWELSRHQGLVTLGQAWWCTRDRRYLDHCALLLTRWLDDNPPKQGVNWGSSLEVSFRAIAWLWVLALTEDALEPALRCRMAGHLAIAGRHIERYLSTWFSPNTHLTGEALGLYLLGTALVPGPQAERWRGRGEAILLEWLDRHVRADGTYVEQSTWYHRYTTDFYLHFLVLSERSGRSMRSRLSGPLGRLLDHLAWITRPDGTMPLIGDDDGGRLLWLDDRTAHDTRNALSAGAVLLGRGDLASVAGAPTSELVWLLGPAGLRAFKALAPSVPVARSKSFPDGGLHVIRSGWDRAASVMTVDAGPHGFMNGGHAHADALSIDLALNGHPVLVDPGTFTYTNPPLWRDRFRETAAHNAVTIDGCGSAIAAGPFRWASRAEGELVAWYDGGSAVLFAGSHDGFERLHPPIAYRRSIAFIAPDLWIVRDEIDAVGEHELAVHWQCAPGLAATVDAAGILLSREGVATFHLAVAEPGGSWSIGDGWVSPTYGVREAAPHLRHIRHGASPASVTTVLTTAAPPRLAIPNGARPVPAVEVAWGNRRGIFLTRSSGAPEWLETDAAVTWVERSADGSWTSVVAADVSRMVVSGRSLMNTATRVPGIAVSPRHVEVAS